MNECEYTCTLQIDSQCYDRQKTTETVYTFVSVAYQSGTH